MRIPYSFFLSPPDTLGKERGFFKAPPPKKNNLYLTRNAKEMVRKTEKENQQIMSIKKTGSIQRFSPALFLPSSSTQSYGLSVTKINRSYLLFPASFYLWHLFSPLNVISDSEMKADISIYSRKRIRIIFPLKTSKTEQKKTLSLYWIIMLNLPVTPSNAAKFWSTSPKTVA